MRFENPYSARQYAWGITLEEILVYTCNEKWEKEYIDRTEPKNKLMPMRKLLSLTKLGIYWDSGTNQLIAGMTPDKIKPIMNDMILRSSQKESKTEYIIAISASCNLVQKNLKDPATVDDPEFSVVLNLEPIDVELSKAQLEDIIRLLEFLNEYNRFKIHCQQQKKDQLTNLSVEERENNKLEFKKYLNRIQRFEKKDDYKGEEKIKKVLEKPEDINKFNYLITTLPDEELSSIIKEVLKEIEKEERMKTITEKKVEKKRGWFSWGSKKDDQPDPNKIDPAEIEKLNQYLEETFGESKDESVKLDELAYRKKFNLKVVLQAGSFYFRNAAPNKGEEGVCIYYSGLKTVVDITNKGQTVEVLLQEIGVKLRTKYNESSDYIEAPVVRRLNYWLPPDQSGEFFSLLFEQNPQGKEDGTYVKLDTQALQIIYTPVAISRLSNFFDVKTEDESLKTQALNQIEKVQDKATSAATSAIKANIKKNISINLAAPLIVLPFLPNKPESECWAMDLGKLSVNSRDPKTDQEKYYELFEIALKNMKMQYYPSMGALDQKIRDQPLAEDQKAIFDLLENFDINVNLQKMITGVESTQEGRELSKLNVDIQIPNVYVKTNPKIYRYLLKIGDLFAATPDTSVDQKQVQDQPLVSGEVTRKGYLYVRELTLGNMIWTKYFCVFQGNYLYFFSDETENKPAFNYYIKNAKIITADDLGKDHGFIVSTITSIFNFIVGK